MFAQDARFSAILWCTPPQILADQKAPPAAAARRITTRPPDF